MEGERGIAHRALVLSLLVGAAGIAFLLALALRPSSAGAAELPDLLGPSGIVAPISGAAAEVTTAVADVARGPVGQLADATTPITGPITDHVAPPAGELLDRAGQELAPVTRPITDPLVDLVDRAVPGVEPLVDHLNPVIDPVVGLLPKPPIDLGGLPLPGVPGGGGIPVPGAPSPATGGLSSPDGLARALTAEADVLVPMGTGPAVLTHLQVLAPAMPPALVAGLTELPIAAAPWSVLTDLTGGGASPFASLVGVASGPASTTARHLGQPDLPVAVLAVALLGLALVAMRVHRSQLRPPREPARLVPTSPG